MNLIKFDLGGVGKGKDGYKTVNLASDCDIHEDIMLLDKFCDDGTVDEFYMSHTLEHIPVTCYVKFIANLRRKLKAGGFVKIIQTDCGESMKLWVAGKISFRAARLLVFTPANRCVHNMLQQHQNMWNQEEMIRDFNAMGFNASGFNAGSWRFDCHDDIIPGYTAREIGLGVRIPNLGVIAVKKAD